MMDDWTVLARLITPYYYIYMLVARDRLWSLLPMGATQCANHYPTVCIYYSYLSFFPSVIIIWMRSLKFSKTFKLQLDRPLPKRAGGGSKPEYPEKIPRQPVRKLVWHTILEAKIHHPNLESNTSDTGDKFARSERAGYNPLNNRLP